jgi:hypothetical protein
MRIQWQIKQIEWPDPSLPAIPVEVTGNCESLDEYPGLGAGLKLWVWIPRSLLDLPAIEAEVHRRVRSHLAAVTALSP